MSFNDHIYFDGSLQSKGLDGAETRTSELRKCMILFHCFSIFRTWVAFETLFTGDSDTTKGIKTHGPFIIKWISEQGQ
jgi:hypothetical protein